LEKKWVANRKNMPGQKDHPRANKKYSRGGGQKTQQHERHDAALCALQIASGPKEKSSKEKRNTLFHEKSPKKKQGLVKDKSPNSNVTAARVKFLEMARGREWKRQQGTPQNEEPETRSRKTRNPPKNKTSRIEKNYISPQRRKGEGTNGPRMSNASKMTKKRGVASAS